MKTQRKIFSLLLLVAPVICPQKSAAQNYGVNTITTAVPFLLITPDARAGAMGETGVATTPDANSIHWNGAKLALLPQQFGVSLSYTPWMRELLPNVNLGYASGYLRLNDRSAVGASFRYFSMGTVTLTSSGFVIGQYKPNEYAGDIAYARQVGKRFSVSVAGRYIYSNVVNSITAFAQSVKGQQDLAIDLSAFYHYDSISVLGKNSMLLAGAAVTNAGPKFPNYGTKDFLPANLRLGVGMVAELAARHSLGLQAEFNKLLVPTPPVYGQNGTVISGMSPNVSALQGMKQSFYDAPGGLREELSEITTGVGAEYWYNKLVAARAGYYYQSPGKGNIQYVSVGAGVRYNVFRLDLSYLMPTNGQRSPLQKTMRFTLAFDFNKAKR